jgi:hypothetical protein
MALTTVRPQGMGFNTGRRNLIINGAMQVAQRGTSSTTNGYTIDRFVMYGSGPTTTKSQQTLTSGSPYDEGFRYFVRQNNDSASSATNAYVYTAQFIESQTIAGSGWNYKSSSSHVTLSFWVRSSLAGTYYAGLTTYDSPEYIRHKAFTLVANTWTKVTFTTAGNSNLVFNNDSGRGLFVEVIPYYGTDYTGGEEVNTNDWYSRGGNLDAYYPNFAQNWANTASATFDVTGVQLELGENASDFEHRSFGEELALCQRYCQVRSSEGVNYGVFASGGLVASNVAYFTIPHVTTMRAAPSNSITGTFRVDTGNNTHTSFTFDRQTTHSLRAIVATSSITSSVGQLQADGTNTSTIISDSEL